MQTDFEAMSGTYTQVGDYLLPERTEFFVRKSRIKEGYCDKIQYIFRLVV